MNPLIIWAPLLLMVVMYNLSDLVMTRAAVAHQQCQVDNDCPGGSFCELNNKICETCVPCQELFNRQPTGQNPLMCVRSEEDCGPCLPGYQNEYHTVQRSSFKCYPSIDQSKLIPDPSTKDHWKIITGVSVALVAFAIVLAIVFAIVFAIICYFKRRRSSPPGEENSKLINNDGVPGAENNDGPRPPQDQVGDGSRTTPGGSSLLSTQNDEPDDSHNTDGPQQDSSSMTGSTQTIPSSWSSEPSSFPAGVPRPAVDHPPVSPASFHSCQSSTDVFNWQTSQTSVRDSILSQSMSALNNEPLPHPEQTPVAQQGSQDSGFHSLPRPHPTGRRGDAQPR